MPKKMKGSKEKISLIEAYSSVRTFFKNNVELLKDYHSPEVPHLVPAKLISLMPDPSKATELEMRAVLGEVIQGCLKWGNEHSDDSLSMGQYASLALEDFDGHKLSDEEVSALSSSEIWIYTTYGRAEYLLQEALRSINATAFPDAERFYRDALKFAASHGNQVIQLEVLIGLGSIHMKFPNDKNIAEARNEYFDALKLAQNLKDDRSEVCARMGIALVLVLGDGNYEAAKKELKHAREIAESLYKEKPEENRHLLLDVLFALQSTFEQMGENQPSPSIDKRLKELRKDAARSARHKPTPLTSPVTPDSVPTPKIETDHWVAEDSLGYLPHARTIASIITHEETTPPLVIGIKAAWGAGKTSMMRIVQHMLDGYVCDPDKKIKKDNRPAPTLGDLMGGVEPASEPITPKASRKGAIFNVPPRITVWFNAWKYQSSEQVWAGMAHAIISQVAERMTPANREAFWLKLYLKRVDQNKIRRNVYKTLLEDFLPKALVYCILATFLIIATIALSGLTKLIPVASAFIAILSGICHFGKDKKSKYSEKLASSFKEAVRQPEYEKKMGYLHLVETDIRDVLDLVAKPDCPLVVFIDDLDRCSPHKTAEVIEALNLFMSGDFPNCIFVLGMEPGMVAAALEVANEKVMKKLAEFSLDGSQKPLGWRFMEKFIQLPLVIPPPTEMGKQRYIEKLTRKPETAGDESLPEKVPIPVESEVKIMQAELSEAKTIDDVEKMVSEKMEGLELEERVNVAEAAKRVRMEKATDNDPEIIKFIEKASEIVDINPRQIKRYISLFRFVNTLRYNISIDYETLDKELPVMPSDEQLTKYVMLCVEWPQALDCMAVKREFEAEDGTRSSASLFSLMENKASELGVNNNTPEADKAWKEFISKHCHFKLENVNQRYEWILSPRFRHFLAKEPAISDVQGHGVY